MISSLWSTKFLNACSILVWDPHRVNLRPSIADMLRPSMRTLKHIVVNINVSGGNDPLFGIPSEFEYMCSKNIIETITIRIIFRTYSQRGDNWSRLDKVLTTPGWFSLKRVSLVIDISIFYRENELVIALRNFAETQFPRLSSSNTVSFDFEVIPYIELTLLE